MPVIDLRGKEQERQAQMLMMMQQFRSRSSLSGGESEYDRVTKEIEAQHLKEAADARASAVAGATIGANQALTEQRINKTNLETWGAGQKNVLDWSEEERKKRELEEGTLPLKRAQTGAAEAEIPLRQAQTGEAKARTSLVQQDIEAKKNWMTQQDDEALAKHTNDQWNMGVQNIISGNPSALTKDNADTLEKAGKLKYGPGFTLPRTEDGSLDPKAVPNIAATVTDKNGQPSADFAKDLHAAEKPNTPFEANVRSWQDAINRGKPEEAKWYADKLWTDVQPTVGKVQGALLKQMFDDGDVDGIKQTLPGFRPSGGKGASMALPPAQARQQTEDGLNTLGQIQRLNEQFTDLVKTQPLPPTGRMVMPMYDFWAAIQHSNPDVQAFRANLKDVVAQYRKFITGKASNEKEMADLLQAVPNENDDVRAFTKKLAEMRWKTTRRVRTDLGIQQAYGLKIPDEIANLGPDFAPISPHDVITKWGTPDINTDSGRRMWHAGELRKARLQLATRSDGRVSRSVVSPKSEQGRAAWAVR